MTDAIILINAQSLVSKFEEIYHFVLKMNPLIVCLTETRLTVEIENFEIDILGYYIVRVDSENRHTGGVVVYLKENITLLEAKRYQFQKNYWFLVVKITLNNKIYMLGNLYHSPSASDSDFLNFFEQWCEGLTDSNCNIIIMGDFNINWLASSTYSNKLKKIVSDAGLYQMVGTVTHPNDNNGSIIDLVLTNKNNILQCRVIETPRISDHFIIGTKIGQCSGSNQENLTIQTRGRIDYNVINDKLSNIIWDYRGNDIDNKYCMFYNHIKGILEEVAPRVEKVIKPKFKEWYNDRVKKAIENRDNSYKKLKANKNLDNRLEYKKNRNTVVTVIRAERKKYYQNKIDLSKNNPKQMWNTLSQLISGKKKNNISKLKINDSVLRDTKEIADSLNSYFVESINDIKKKIDKHIVGSWNQSASDSIEQNYIDSFDLIDYNDLRETVFSLPNKGSPDDITSEFLKNTYINIEKPLLNLINSSLELGQIPSLLKISTVIPIQKVKGTISAAEFRPINMLVTIEKILEKIVYRQLMQFISANNILIGNQSGFRKNHSCESAIQNILYEWKDLLDENYVIGAVFLDLQRAFETIDRDTLIQKLKQIGIINRALDWLIDYLNNRKQVTKIDTHISSELSNTSGVPQGSTLGPLLFLVYINDVVKEINNCSIHLFADDTLLYFSSKDLNHLTETINLELIQLHKWFNGMSLKLNTQKTKFMLIGNNTFQNQFKLSNLSIKVENITLEVVEKTKYLGFIVDNHLTFKDHALYIIDKITKNVNFLSRVSPFLSRWSRVTVYNTLVLPHLVFSSSILYLANKNELNRLQKLQNRCMRMILAAKRDTPIKNMQRELKWLSVEKFLQYQVLTLVYKIKNGLTPNYLTEKLVTNETVHTYPTRNKHNFYITTKNRTSSEKAIFHKGLIVFNSLPGHIKNIPKLNSFKAKLKEHLMGE